ncbi:MAG TPA: response regulator transcription factor [Bryobacteraceae bacterium]|nr:response regulator transcription factor [Bryobacteraceae bacterium]
MSPAISPQPIRLYLLDDHALFREGLVRLLGADPEFVLVGAEGDPAKGLEVLRREAVDVLLLDYDLGPFCSEEFVAAARGSGFRGKILLVTAGLPDRDALRVIRAGVAGIFHKQQAPDDLRRSIREVFDGKVLIDEHYLRKLVQVATEPEAAGIRLTDREKQTLRLLIEGLANKEIAAQLNISESAVKATLQMLFNKTGVRTRSQLVRIALQRFQDEI